VAASNFLGEVRLRGAKLTLSGNGRLNNAWKFEIENGGTLFLDNSGTAQADRISDFAIIELSTGNLHLSGRSSGSLTEQVGQLLLSSGANTIQLTHQGGAGSFTALALAIFQPEGFSTFNLTANRRFGTGDDLNSVRLFVNTPFGFPFPIGQALWMGTVEGEDWVIPTQPGDGNTYFVPLSSGDYYTGTPQSWNSSHEVLIQNNNTTYVPWSSTGIQINTLKLGNSANLELDATLHTMGLLSTGQSDNYIYGWNGRLRFLYAHVYSPTLHITNGVTLFSGFTKTGPGTLRINAPSAWHQVNTLVIHQGRVVFQSGNMETRTLYIGDGTGTDIMELPANRFDPIEGVGTSEEPARRLFITLKGSPYGDPNSGEFDSAILRFGGGTVQNAYQLQVEGRGTLDFAGGTESAPNQLFLEHLILADFDTTMLFIRNWIDQQDFLLVRRSQANINRIDSDFLSRIYFEDHGGPGAEWVYWNDLYWQIRPLPEPSTYGAIFGIVGLGLITWRKWRRVSKERSAK